MNVLLSLALGYLVGSIPFAYLIVRSQGVDIFRTGTGNPGAANVFRKVGRRTGIAVLLGDVAKGVVPVLLARWAGLSPWLALAVGIAALAGHWYPVFLRFRGGAGLATAIGVAYGVMWLPALAATAPALGLLYFMRNTGVAAGLGSVLLFATAVLMRESIVLALAVSLLPALALARQRLLPTPGAQREAGNGPAERS